MAIQSLTDLKALINSTIQDNTTNDISGSDVQTALINAIDTLNSLEGFINVHKANGQTTITAYGSKALARAAVPDDCKKEGVVIAYKISTGWLIEQNLDATAGTWGDDASWQTIGPVSVSQNTETGKEELSIGGDVKWILDEEPEAGSDNLVKSRSVYNLETLIGKVTIFEETTSGNSQKTFKFDFKKGTTYKLLNLGDYLPQYVYLCSSFENPIDNRIQTINTNYILANQSVEFECTVDGAICINSWLPAHTKFSLEEVNSLNNRIQKNTDDIDELEPKVSALEENKKETDAVSADGFNGATYSGTSAEISAYYGGWCYVRPIFIKKGTKAIITVSNADSAIRESSALTIVRPDTTYFSTNVIFKQNVPTEYIFEDDAVSVGRYATLTVTGTFSINVQVIPFAERINILENNLDYKYPPYPIWGHEYMQAWYKKMYLASGSTTFKIVCAGDSTTLNGNRDVYVKRLMVFRNWNENNINCVNMGVNGAQTESWIGSSESTPQYGYLDAQMAENPDLIVLGYGLNDGSNIQYPSLTWEERAANFESRLREGLGRIRTNGTFTSGPSYNKPASELAIIITTPISISPDNNTGNTNTADNWCKLIDPIIKKACRDFQCAYANFTAREYDHTWNKAWSISNDGIHPDSFIQKEMMALLSDLVCPITYTWS